MNTNQSTATGFALRDSEWAMGLFGYTAKRRSAFWQFCKANGVPHVRTGKKKVQFSEAAVTEWIATRSSTGRALQ